MPAGDAALRNPTTGSTDCCARAASGHAAAPPSSVMNSRHLVGEDVKARVYGPRDRVQRRASSAHSSKYASYYNEVRTHLSLGKDASLHTPDRAVRRHYCAADPWWAAP